MAAALGVAVIVAALVAVLVPRSRTVLVGSARHARPGWWTVLFFLLVTGGGICAQNLAFLSMPPLISARYLAMAWPFCAFLPLLLCAPWPRLRPALTAAFCLLLLLPVTVLAPLPYGHADRMPIGRLDSASAILVDNVGVGQLPRFLWSVPGGTPVYVGTQTQLLAQPQNWIGKLGGRAYYVGFIGNGDTHAGRKRILALLGGRYAVDRVARSKLADLYLIMPRP